MWNCLVFDVGLFDGTDTAYYLNRGAKVVAVEANPAYAEVARNRFAKEIEAGNLIVCNVGVGDEPGQMPFYVTERRPLKSSFDKERALGTGGKISEVTVPVTTLGALIEEHGIPEFLKLDVEGADEACLKHIQENPPQFLSIETNGTVEMLDQVAHAGYSKFRLVSQFSFLSLDQIKQKEYAGYQRFLQTKMLPVRILRRMGLRDLVIGRLHPKARYGGFHMVRHGSGPAPFEAAGEWGTLADAKELYQDALATDPILTSWIDLHAAV